MIVTIHQPEHLPWLGFFNKMAEADVFVVLDTVQYEKNYFQNRNRVRTPSTEQGWAWVTVPVLAKGRTDQAIMDVEINNSDRRWGEKNWRTIEQNYRKAPYFDQYADLIRDTYTTGTRSNLVELNLNLIHHFTQALEITTSMVRASALNAHGSSSELLVAICEELGADTYLSGPSGKDYLDEGLFHEANVSVEFHDFHHPEYRQLHQPFIPAMSVIDILFNQGPASRDIILGRNR